MSEEDRVSQHGNLFNLLAFHGQRDRANTRIVG
jgi:hypothetical protein